MPYSEMMVKPMREEMIAMGAKELKTVAEVDAALGDAQGSVLVFVNSVCGCAAGMARPGVRLALQHKNKPERLGTVFAGQDKDATAQARGHFAHIPPSSPSVALFVNGKVVDFLPRHRIEGRTAQQVSAELVAMFDKHLEKA